MKKVTSIICVLCLIVGMMTGLEFIPAVETAAMEELNEIPGKITVIDFSSLAEFPRSGNYAEVKVASGSAITFSAGGNTKWTYGLIAIEPDDGWTFTGAKYKKDETDTELKVAKLSEVISKIKEDSGYNVPSKVSTVFEGLSAEELQNSAIYIDRATYTNIVWGDDIVLSYKKGEEEGQLKIQLNRDFRNYNIEKSVGDTFNFFELGVVKKEVLENGKYKKTDFSIQHYGINSTPSTALKELYESEQSENFGEFEVEQTGKNEIYLVNKYNGIQHEFSVDMVESGELPLSMDDFIVDEESVIKNDTGDKDTGKYSVYPEGKNVFKNFSMNFHLPDGVTVSKISLAANGTEGEVVISSDKGSKETTIYYDEDPITVNYLKSEDNNVKIDISIKSDNKIISGNINVVLNKNDKDYNYSFLLWYNRPFSISGQGSQTYPVAYKRVLKLVDYISTSNPEDIQKLYDGITSGDYTVDMQGIKPIFENGIFKGNLVAYYPCDYMSLNDNTTSTVLYNGSSLFQIMNTTAIEAGQILDMSTLLNGYWNYGKDDIYVEGSDDFEIKADEQGVTKLFAAPVSVSEITMYTVTIKQSDKTLAIFKIKVCPKDTLLTSLVEIVQEVGAEESLTVNLTGGDDSISKEVINSYREKGGKNSTFIISDSEDSHKTEWQFNIDDMENTMENDIALSVTVGNELVDENLDSVMEENGIEGLKLGFENNGQLPGKTIVRLTLSGEEVALLEDTDNVQLYYYDAKSEGFELAELKLEAENLYVAHDDVNGTYFIDVPVTHNSDFVLSSNKIDTGSETEKTCYGDVNGDKKIDSKDVTMLRRHLVGGWNVTIIEKNADVNKDGKVDAKDVTILSRFLAGGWGIVL